MVASTIVVRSHSSVPSDSGVSVGTRNALASTVSTGTHARIGPDHAQERLTDCLMMS